MNCSISGWTANESKATEIGSTPEDRDFSILFTLSIRIVGRLCLSLLQECCIPLCGNSDQVKCPFGWAVQDEDAKKTSDGTMEARLQLTAHQLMCSFLCCHLNKPPMRSVEG